MKKISIIVPVYNGSKFITSCIDYLVEQNYPNMEVIFVVDVKTTDDTISLIEENKNRLPNILTYIQTDNYRLGGARNIGMKKSTGDLIWFLDVDDRPLPTFVSEMVTIQEKYDADIVICNFLRSDCLDIPILDGLSFNVKKMDRYEAMKSRCEEGFPVTAWSKMYKRDLITDNNLEYKSGLAEDVDFTYRSLSKANIICYYNKPLYIYYQNLGSICNSNQNNDRGLREIEVYKELSEYFKTDCPEFVETFNRKTAVTRMRSLVHMDYELYLKTYKEGDVLSQILKYRRTPPTIETVIFRVSPYLYYHIAKIVSNRIYCKNNTMFDENNRKKNPVEKLFYKMIRKI